MWQKYLDYEKDLKKNRFEPNGQAYKTILLTIIIRCVFSEDDKFYPQLFLDDALYDV